MERKYYLRGLGLGIIVTAILMGITLSGGTKTREMTDDEVIARAKELGMIEDSRLLEPSDTAAGGEETPEAEAPVRKDIAVKAEAEAAFEKTDEAQAGAGDGEAEGAQPDTASGADTETGTQSKLIVDTPKPVDTTASSASSETKPRTDTNEMTKQDDDAHPSSAASTAMKSITIVGGDGSYTVAQKLEAAGIVSSASAYDTYLCEHGYDKKLRTGTFQIPAGATDEQIARIVTGQQ